MTFVHIQNEKQFQETIQKEKCVVFKHSNTCSRSAQAYDEVQQFVTSHPEVPVYYLIVQTDRSLSNHIAETTKIRHESPQIFIFENEKVVWNDKHWQITSRAIEENWKK